MKTIINRDSVREQITVISGTNRSESNTAIVAKFYLEILKKKEQNPLFFSLVDLHKDFAFNNDIFGKKNPGFSRMIKKFFANAPKLVFVVPEYNGSIPGVLKTLIDGIDPRVFEGKKAALVGVASGRSGNVRGMDHLTNILNYLEVQVLPFKVPVSRVMAIVSNGKIMDENTKKTLRVQAEKFIKF